MVKVHSPATTLLKPEGPLTMATAPVSSMVDGEELAMGLDDAAGDEDAPEPVPPPDDATGAVVAPGVAAPGVAAPGDVPGLDPTLAPAHPAAMTMTARIDCQASDFVTRMSSPFVGTGRAQWTGMPRP